MARPGTRSWNVLNGGPAQRVCGAPPPVSPWSPSPLPLARFGPLQEGRTVRGRSDLAENWNEIDVTMGSRSSASSSSRSSCSICASRCCSRRFSMAWPAARSYVDHLEVLRNRALAAALLHLGLAHLGDLEHLVHLDLELHRRLLHSEARVVLLVDDRRGRTDGPRPRAARVRHLAERRVRVVDAAGAQHD